MTNQLNREFTADPVAFIANPANTVGGHDDLCLAMTGTRDQRFAAGSAGFRATRLLSELVDATSVIAFDFYRYNQGGSRMALLTPIADGTTFQMQAMSQHFRPPSSNPIRGYWFPYLPPTPEEATVARTGAGPSAVFGWVDIPKHNPEYPFCFTGSMQGCHIVVATSPANPSTHYRVYHYPNVSSHWPTRGNMAFNYWPSRTGGEPVAWLDDLAYEHQAPHAVDAFNFLYHDGTRWRIYIQKQERRVVLSKQSGSVLFDHRGTDVMEIPDRPMTQGELMQRATQWRTARGLGNPG
ncbi:MAG: hypothetical protein AAGC55_10935 [Myxococcota bacterium]